MRGKRGIFITLSAIILISIIFLFFMNSLKEDRQKDILKRDKERIFYFDDFVDQLVDHYLPVVITTSSKEALIGISNKTVAGTSIGGINETLEEVMRTGNFSGARFMPMDMTLPAQVQMLHRLMYYPYDSYNLSLGHVGVEHISWNYLEVSYTGNYTLEFPDMKLSRKLNDSVTISIYGLEADAGTVSPQLWKENTSEDCYLKTLNNTYACGGINGFSFDP